MKTNYQKLITDSLVGESETLRHGLQELSGVVWTRRLRARLTRLLDEMVEVNTLIVKTYDMEEL